MSASALTGGIASGKSTVAKLLAVRGIRILDTDAVAAALSAPGGQAVSRLRAAFGDDCLTEDGGLDRAAMRERAFRDPAARKTLEAILHPLIREEVERFLTGVRDIPAVVAIPLYFETMTYRGHFGEVVVVDCPSGTQLNRLVRDRGMDRGIATAIIGAQVPRQVRLQLADRVICNNGSTAALATLVDAWVREWQ